VIEMAASRDVGLGGLRPVFAVGFVVRCLLRVFGAAVCRGVLAAA
jgi:hypothetical protein